MELNEIRAGNYAYMKMSNYFNIDENQVDETIVKIGIVDMERFHELYPIPLTASILKKMGFEKKYCFDKGQDQDYYTLNFSDDLYTDLSLLSSYMTEEGVYVELFPYEVFKFKYVHEVQNLYHSITGKELEFEIELKDLEL